MYNGLDKRFSVLIRQCSVSVSQQSNELKDALDAEMEKTRLMEESMKKLDEVEIFSLFLRTIPKNLSILDNFKKYQRRLLSSVDYWKTVLFLWQCYWF